MIAVPVHAPLLGLRVQPHSSEQYLKNDCGRPAKQQNAIHCRDGPQQAPAFNREHVAVSKCRVVYKGDERRAGELPRGGVSGRLAES